MPYYTGPIQMFFPKQKSTCQNYNRNICPSQNKIIKCEQEYHDFSRFVKIFGIDSRECVLSYYAYIKCFDGAK